MAQVSHFHEISEAVVALNIEPRCYREVFEGVEQQAQRHLGFVEQRLGLRDARQRGAENPAGTNTHTASLYLNCRRSVSAPLSALQRMWVTRLY